MHRQFRTMTVIGLAAVVGGFCNYLVGVSRRLFVL